MKKVELLAERAKITNQIIKSEYFTIKLKGCLGEPANRVNITEAELKENYENSERLLKKLDAINNVLFEADARAYIDVMGNRLSVATARKYLEEFYEDAFLDFRFDDGICALKKDEEVDTGGNLRAAMYRNCIIHELNHFISSLGRSNTFYFFFFSSKYHFIGIWIYYFFNNIRF